MMTPPSLILGNRLDMLAGVLARVLEEEDPFLGRVILTPSAEVKSWLLIELARYSSKGAVAGLKIFSWEEGIRYLVNQPGRELSSFELYLMIYQALQVSEEPEVRAYAKEAKLDDLAKQLADLFVLYGYYGQEFCLGEGLDWQSKLWRSIFLEKNWRAPMQLLAQPMRVREKVHCFGCDVLPPIVWQALLRLDGLKIFHFSPCVSYWADLCTDLERRSLKRKGKKRKVSLQEMEEAEKYWLDAHPLLANWGKAGRETLKIFDEYDMDVQEIYDPWEGRGSFLASLQKDFLFHQVSEAPLDGSVRINKTGPSRLREVQVLYDEMIKAHQSGIAFSDMLVLAPDVNLYAPLIEFVFSDKQRPIAYRISGIDLLSQNGPWQGFKRLLDLGCSRWDAESLLILFENEAFRKGQGWDLERLDRIRQWIHDARIRWGQSGEQKEIALSHWLNKSAPTSLRGTWEQAADRMIHSLIYLFPEEEINLPSSPPIVGIGLGDADEIEQLLELTFQLQKDLAPLADGSLLSPKGWADYFRSLCHLYFPDETLDVLEEILYVLGRAEAKISEKISFSMISDLFERRQSSSKGSSLLHAARIASLEAGAVFPCRALFLLGQDEESFPRSSFFSSLHRCKEFCPFRADLDRYLFLQAVCSARDLLVISYGHISPDDGKERGPSILLREWMSFAKNLIPTVHPSFPWHKRCFEEKQFPMSEENFRAAVVFQEKKEPLQFFPPFSFPTKNGIESTVLLKDLKGAFSHPWKFYLQRKLHLWMQEIEEEDWSDFELGGIERAKLLKMGFSEPLDFVIHALEQKEMFPVGLFGKAARKNVEQTFEEWQKHLAQWDIEPGGISTLALRDARSLQVPFRNSLVSLQGEVRFCSPKGPVHFGEDSFASLLRNWPEYLAALCALGSKEIFCIRSGKVRVVDSPWKALEQCLEIYSLALQTPLPLVSQWSDSLVRRQDPEELAKHFEQERAIFEDPIYDWVFSRIEPPSPALLVADWGPFFQEHLSALISLYPVRGSHAKI